LTDSGATARGWSAYAGASIRGVARNDLLTHDYDPTLPELKVRHAVGRGAAGLTYSASWGAFHFGVARETREFVGQHTGQAFGSLTLHFSF
jgi:hypothetical protein